MVTISTRLKIFCSKKNGQFENVYKRLVHIIVMHYKFFSKISILLRKIPENPHEKYLGYNSLIVITYIPISILKSTKTIEKNSILCE